MRAIWKYELMLVDDPRVEMQAGAKVLSAAIQFDKLCVWALVDTEVGTEVNAFRIVGTGHNFPDADQWDFLTTVAVDGGQFMFHLFTPRSGEPRV